MQVPKNGNPIQFNSMTLSDDNASRGKGKKRQKKKRKKEGKMITTNI
jgi:hypothetical protein